MFARFTVNKVFVFISIGLCISCGIKGPPLPPLDESVAKKQKAESVTVPTATMSSASQDTTKAKINSKAKEKKVKK